MNDLSLLRISDENDRRKAYFGMDGVRKLDSRDILR